MKVIRLTEMEYETLISELQALGFYRFDDSRINLKDCSSAILPIIEARVEENVLTFFE